MLNVVVAKVTKAMGALFLGRLTSRRWMSRAQAVKDAVVICFRPNTLCGGDGKSDYKCVLRA